MPFETRSVKPWQSAALSVRAVPGGCLFTLTTESDGRKLKEERFVKDDLDEIGAGNQAVFGCLVIDSLATKMKDLLLTRQCLPGQRLKIAR